jgi:hypothetical protein
MKSRRTSRALAQETVPSIRRRLFDVIDNEDVHRACLRHQFERELRPQRFIDHWEEPSGRVADGT